MAQLHGATHARRGLITAALATAALVLAACGVKSSGSNSATSTATGPSTNVNAVSHGKFAKPIILGAAVASSGLQQVNDVPPMIGLRMAVDDINKAGGIDGQKVQIITSNTDSTVAGQRNAALDVMHRGAQILIATCNYDLGVSGGDVGQADHVLTWSLCAASPLWGPKGIGQMAFVDSIMTYPEGNVGAQFGYTHFGPDVFTLCDTFIDYTDQTCQGFKEEITKLGGKVVGSATFNDVTDSKVSAQISKIKAAKNARWIYLPTIQPGGISALRQIRAAGINLPVISPTAAWGLSWLKSVPHLTNYYVDTEASETGDDPRPAVNTLSGRYKAQYGNWPDNANFQEGYSMMQIIKDALAAQKTTNGWTLSNYIQHHSFSTVMGPKQFSVNCHFPFKEPYVMTEYTTTAGQTYPFPKYVATLYPKDVNYHGTTPTGTC